MLSVERAGGFRNDDDGDDFHSQAKNRESVFLLTGEQYSCLVTDNARAGNTLEGCNRQRVTKSPPYVVTLSL